jgi:beta-N-acetylhexosaminidase
MYEVFGRELRALRIACDLAPVSDVNSNPKNPIIVARSFGQDPQRVAADVSAAVRGLHASGTRACAKHFPGHGNTSQDTHRGLATVNRTREQILEIDLLPFRAAIQAGVDIVMTAHLLYPAFDAEWPATLSPAILQGVLRKQLGFRGVILTDSFSMGAIRRMYRPEEAVIRAINAGADLIMLAEERYNEQRTNYLSEQVQLIEAICGAVREGRIPTSRLDDVVRRVLELKAAAGLFESPSPNLAEARQVIASKQNQEVALATARAAVTIFRDRDHRLPLRSTKDQKIVVVMPVPAGAYASLGRMRGIGPNISRPPAEELFRNLQSRIPAAELIRITDPKDVPVYLSRLRAASVVVVPTENFPLPGFDFPTAPQKAVIDALIDAGLSPVIVGLRDPYDLLNLPTVQTYISALGYAPVCAQAAVEVLLGERQATGNPDFKFS